MKTTAAAARRPPPAPGAARVPEPAVVPAVGSAPRTTASRGARREGGVWKRTYPAPAGHHASVLIPSRASTEIQTWPRSPEPPPPVCPPAPQGHPSSRRCPSKPGPRQAAAGPLPGGGCWGARAWGQRVAGPYLQGSPWPAAGRSACPPGAMPAPSIPSPAPHGTLLQRPPPAATGWC